MRAEQHSVGVALQAYVRRTPADLEALLPLGPTIRLVKGAYNEPASVAFPRKHDVDEQYYQLAGTLLEHTKRGTRPVLGTHDLGLIGRIRARGGASCAARVVRGAHAVRDPHGSAAGPCGRGSPGARADQLRPRVVRLVHAPPRGAAGERVVRPEEPGMNRSLLVLCALAGVPVAAAAQGGKAWPPNSLDRPKPPVVDPGPKRPPVPPPSDAIVLFDGTDLSQGQMRDSTPAKWVVRAGHLEGA